MGLPGFRWTDEFGSDRALVLAQRFMVRSGYEANVRSSFRSVGLDQRTTFTEELEGGAFMLSGEVRFSGSPKALLDMLQAGRAGKILTYYPDITLPFDGYPGVLEHATQVRAIPDPDRFGFNEWSSEILLRRVDGADFPLMTQIGLATILRGAYDASTKESPSVVRTALGATLTGTTKWTGSVVARDGRIFGVPSSASDVLVIDPRTNTASRNTYGLLGDQPVAQAWQLTEPSTYVDETVDVNDVGTADFPLLLASTTIYLIMGFAHRTSQLKFNVSGVAATGTVQYEYWNGSSWTAFSNVTDGTNHWRNSGTNTVTWDVPTNWAASIINSVGPLYYVRIKPQTTGTSGTGTQAWFSSLPAGGQVGGALGLDGKIYCAPYDAKMVLVIDPQTDTATVTNFGLALNGTAKYAGLVMGRNGKLYAVPQSATTILIIDTVTQTASLSAMGATLTGTFKWDSGTLGTNGKIYCSPSNATDVLIIDPEANTATRNTFGLTLPGSNAWQGSVLGHDGKIYHIPFNATNILIVTPATNSAVLLTLGVSLTGSEKWQYGQLGPDGRIYGAPRDATDILVIDTVLQTATRTDFGTSLTGTDKWAGLAHGPDTRLYGIPLSATDVMVINPKGAGGIPRAVMLGAHYNKA